MKILGGNPIKLFFIVVGVIAGFELLVGAFTDTPVPSPTPLSTPGVIAEVTPIISQEPEVAGAVTSVESREVAYVESVVDGDTIKLSTGDVVRYIGVDTPETVDPRTPPQCLGKEASNKNKELVEGKSVRLERDVSDTDRYGRLLRYVYLEDGRMVNDILAREGFAKAASYPPDVKYQRQLLEAEQSARTNQWGLWSTTCSDPVSTQAFTAPQSLSTPVVNATQMPATDTSQQRATTTSANCSTNTYNCPDFSTQSEAQAVFDTCGGVTNDIHRLDSDSDGVACETLP